MHLGRLVLSSTEDPLIWELLNVTAVTALTVGNVGFDAIATAPEVPHRCIYLKSF
jgi:hypothetical protein